MFYALIQSHIKYIKCFKVHFFCVVLNWMICSYVSLVLIIISTVVCDRPISTNSCIHYGPLHIAQLCVPILIYWLSYGAQQTCYWPTHLAIKILSDLLIQTKKHCVSGNVCKGLYKTPSGLASHAPQVLNISIQVTGGAHRETVAHVRQAAEHANRHASSRYGCLFVHRCVSCFAIKSFSSPRANNSAVGS